MNFLEHKILDSNFNSVTKRRIFYQKLLGKADDGDENNAKKVLIEFFSELQKDRKKDYDNMLQPYDKEIQQPFGPHEIIFSTYVLILGDFREHYLNGEYIMAANVLCELNQTQPCFLRGTREGIIEAGKILLGDDFP